VLERIVPRCASYASSRRSSNVAITSNPTEPRIISNKEIIESALSLVSLSQCRGPPVKAEAGRVAREQVPQRLYRTFQKIARAFRESPID